MNEIFISFRNLSMAETVAKALMHRGMRVAKVTKNINDIIQNLQYFKSGIIICGTNFNGTSYRDIADLIPAHFSVILIGKREELINYDDNRTFKLATPLNVRDLICSIDMMDITDISGYKPKDMKSVNEQNIITNAKIKLMDTYHMDEEKAHRFIQKKSMETGRKLSDIAKLILEL